jgi:hypothetical protein
MIERIRLKKKKQKRVENWWIAIFFFEGGLWLKMLL